MVGLVIARGVSCLDRALSLVKELVNSSIPAVAECLAALHETVNDHAALLLAHAMHLVTGYFKDLSFKC